MSTAALVLAAGLGTRMKSSLPKVLHPVLGDPALLWVLRSLPPEVTRAVLVLHHGKEQVETALDAWRKAGLLPCPVDTVDQGEPLGTGHAAQAAAAALDACGAARVVVLCGDVPLLTRETIARLAAREAALLAMELPDATGYGRVIQGTDGRLEALVEQKDASEAQRAVRLANGGAYALPWPALREALAGLRNDNAQREYYLTDAVVAVSRRVPVQIERCEAEELLGMNARKDQAALERLAQARINGRWMEEGVSFQDPASARIGPRVALARDVVVGPGVCLEGSVEVGEGVRIGQGCVLKDCTVGSGTEFRPYCIAEKARVGAGAKVGPFAHLREGTVLEDAVHMGNFVETKKAHLKTGAKANHLSYLGDCEVGEKSNIGAGCITCNYDGFRKHRTLIGRDVFVGSDCQLVAPVALGDGCLVGAGTTVTGDVPADALALSRAPMTLRKEAASKLRARFKAHLG